MDVRGLTGLILISAALASGCGAPKYDGSTLEGKAAILDNVYLALSNEDCTSAIAQVEGLYGSTNTDNQVRMARASAQGCAAGVSNFFQLLSDISANSGALGGPGIWDVFVKLFNNSSSTVLDKHIAAGLNATDALMSAVLAGTVTSTANQINTGTTNVGTVVSADRIQDANAYLVFISMATVGAYQSQFGAPNPSTFAQGQLLGATVGNPNGWADATATSGDGCGFASSVLNLLDAIEEIKPSLSGALQTELTTITSAFSAVIDLACQAGCQGAGGTVNGVSYAVTGCGLAASACAGSATHPCPLALRNRANCTGLVTNAASCAAAGIANFVNADPLGGWQ